MLACSRADANVTGLALTDTPAMVDDGVPDTLIHLVSHLSVHQQRTSVVTGKSTQWSTIQHPKKEQAVCVRL